MKRPDAAAVADLAKRFESSPAANAYSHSMPTSPTTMYDRTTELR